MAKAAIKLPVEKQPGSLTESIEQHLETYFSAHEGDLPASGLYGRVISEVERCLITHTLKAVSSNQLKAADVLGINRNTLRKKIQELDIALPAKSRK